jgi:HEAT repeat protein
MKIFLKLYKKCFIISFSVIFLISGCAKVSQYALEDVEKQRLQSNLGDKKALQVLTEIYKDKSQSAEVRLAALRALSESRNPQIIKDIQGSVSRSSLIELDLMKEAIKIVIDFQDVNSTDSLMSALNSTETKTTEIRTEILNAIGKNGSKNEVELLLKLYDVSKRSNVQMNQLLTKNLGEIGDEKVIPILMDIAKNKKLPLSIRSQAIDVLSKKNAPELVDFFVEMLGDPASRDKINEFALDVMGEMPEERMLMALLEAYQIGRHKYYALLNSIISSLDNFENPEIKSLYIEIAQTDNFPANIRLKAFKGLAQYSDPDAITDLIKLLNNPANYIYYSDIIKILEELGVYEKYQQQLRHAAFMAMKKENQTIND